MTASQILLTLALQMNMGSIEGALFDIDTGNVFKKAHECCKQVEFVAQDGIPSLERSEWQRRKSQAEIVGTHRS